MTKKFSLATMLPLTIGNTTNNVLTLFLVKGKPIQCADENEAQKIIEALPKNQTYFVVPYFI